MQIWNVLYLPLTKAPVPIVGGHRDMVAHCLGLTGSKQCCGSGIRSPVLFCPLDTGSRMISRSRLSDPRFQTNISQNLVTIFRVKKCVKFIDTEKVPYGPKKNLYLFLFVFVGSGIRDREKFILDPVSRGAKKHRLADDFLSIRPF
jgi:hypothetical protein